jgi:hypothetical protein
MPFISSIFPNNGVCEDISDLKIEIGGFRTNYQGHTNLNLLKQFIPVVNELE